jgi:hypothetical protein
VCACQAAFTAAEAVLPLLLPPLLLLQLAMASQQAGCVRLVVDALLEGRFSKASVVAHMYEALQALIHDPQVCICIAPSSAV